MVILKDWAWEDINTDLLRKFKTGIFSIIWYIPWKNDDELIMYLNLYRKYINKNVS